MFVATHLAVLAKLLREPGKLLQFIRRYCFPMYGQGENKIIHVYISCLNLERKCVAKENSVTYTQSLVCNLFFLKAAKLKPDWAEDLQASREMLQKLSLSSQQTCLL